LAAAGLLPALLLLAAAEGIVRMVGLDEPALRATGVPGEEKGLLAPDRDLFWSLQPSLRRVLSGAIVSTNALGLRGEPVGPKQEDEYRILSLGESSTFGIGVGDAQTYSSRLGVHLNEALPERHVTVANAGVPAWSSFQSLKYLELRGLELEPDLVLFYHELNDYLPSSLRDSSNNEIGALQTDRELYDSRLQRTRRAFFERSALFRFLSYQIARLRIAGFGTADFDNPLLDIGLPDIGLAPRLKQRDGEAVARNEWVLGRRVSEPERLRNLEELQALARREGLSLVLIHPAYRHSERHTCLLTEFAERSGIPWFEAFDSLHIDGEPEESSFLDSMHPSREGHERLARDLAGFVAREVLRDGTGPAERAGAS
jgi:hypothetical protein